MKKKLLSLLLALTLCLGLLPVGAFAAQTDLPDWYFLFAIFKNVDADCIDRNGVKQHVKYSMPQSEVDFFRVQAKAFEEFMSQVGVMRAHVDVVEIDQTLKELQAYPGEGYGSYLAEAQAEPLLVGKVDLDQYDHVMCLVGLDGVDVGHSGMTSYASFANGTGQACINTRSSTFIRIIANPQSTPWNIHTYVHEFLHYMSSVNSKCGAQFDLHEIWYNSFYGANKDDGKECYTDILLNRAKGNEGTGVHPAAWQYQPRVLRTATELTIPSGVTTLGTSAFKGLSSLTKVTLPSGLTSIEGYAFWECTGLKEIVIPASVTSVGYAAFWNSSLKDVYYGGTEAQWKAIQIDKYNETLTKATIHYNTPAAPVVTVENIPASGTALASTQTVSVDGKAVEFQMYALKDANGNLTNYIKLRDMAYVLNGTNAQFSVGYDGTISLTSGQAYQSGGSNMTTPFSGDRAYKGGAQTVKINGQSVNMTAITLTDSNGGDYNYFKLRDLGAALGFNVGYSNEQGVYIESNKPYQG